MADGGQAIHLRPYQLRAVESVEERWAEVVSTLLVMATGLGKTVTFAHIIARRPGRCMVIAHREELIRQAAAKIQTVTGEACDIEMADERADSHIFSRSRCVVGTVQTLMGRRKDRFTPADFSTLIIDEAHHSTSPSYRAVIDHFRGNPDLRVLGVTATPDRADEKALGLVFDAPAMVYDIADGIRDGWLCDISQRFVHVEGLDFANVHTVAGDFNGRELAELMEYETTLHKVADPLLKLARWKKTLVFCVSVAQAERMAEILNRHKPHCARFITGKTPDDERRLTLQDYRAGRFQFLVNVGVFTEGFDEPSIELVAIARPTKSRALYAQMIGRGTRPLPGLVDSDHGEDPAPRVTAIARSKKPMLEVLDFEGNAGQHKLVTTADILGGDYEDDVIELAAKIVRESGQARKMSEAIDEARAVNRAEQERIRRLAEAKRSAVRGSAKFTTKTINPFDIMEMEPPRKRHWDRDVPPTEAQINFLENNGVPIEGLNRNAASALCGELIARRRNGLCTFKQARLLKKHGYDPNATFDEARSIIDALAANGWRRPTDKPQEATAT